MLNVSLWRSIFHTHNRQLLPKPTLIIIWIGYIIVLALVYVLESFGSLKR
jgi:hypothetical protein